MKTSLNKTLLSAALSSLSFAPLSAHAAYVSESPTELFVTRLTAQDSFADLSKQSSSSDPTLSYGRHERKPVVAPAYLPILPAVPEPQTYALLLAGLAAGGFIARRRKLD